MEEVALGAIISRITQALAAARANIKQWSDELAYEDKITAEIQDTMSTMYATAFVSATTEINQQTGKLVYPNIDSQKAATIMKLQKLRYDAHQDELWEHQQTVQKKKNAIVCEHERRGDLKTEVELLKLLGTE